MKPFKLAITNSRLVLFFMTQCDIFLWISEEFNHTIGIIARRLVIWLVMNYCVPLARFNYYNRNKFVQHRHVSWVYTWFSDTISPPPFPYWKNYPILQFYLLKTKQHSFDLYFALNYGNNEFNCRKVPLWTQNFRYLIDMV